MADFFSSFFGGSTTGNSSLFNFNFADYNSIRNGTYRKLMKSYYGQNKDTTAKKPTSTIKNPAQSTSTAKTENKTLAAIEKSADGLVNSAKKLYSTSKVFQKKNVAGEDGKLTMEYDRDAIYSAVNSFVNDYNSLINAAGKSEAEGVERAASSLKSVTKMNSKMLEGVGITVDSEKNTLSLDKDKFNSASIDTIKSLFNGTGSYAYDVATKASMVNYQAEREASKANTYGRNGSFTNNYSSGSIYNSFF